MLGMGVWLLVQLLDRNYPLQLSINSLYIRELSMFKTQHLAYESTEWQYNEPETLT